MNNRHSNLERNPDGSLTAYIEGVAVLVGVDLSELMDAIKTPETTKLGAFLRNKGFENKEIYQWLVNKLPDIAINNILEYYANEAGDRCTEQAYRVYRGASSINDDCISNTRIRRLFLR